MSDIQRMFAVDLGASGGKCFAGLFEKGSFTMKEVHRFDHEGVSFFIPDRSGELSERTYWDDVFIYKNIVLGLHAYRREISERLDAVGIDTWGSDGHLVSADGDMLGKVYCYRDHRLDHMISVVKSLMDPQRMYDITGIHFQPFNISNQLHWFMTHRREMLLPGSVFLPVPSLFYHYLGGSKKVDSTWASVTQLMDARKKAWSREILDALHIPIEIMPEIVAPGADLGQMHGRLAESIGITRAQLIAVGAHDTASAFAAAPIDDTNDALIISSGTWSLVGKLMPEPITTEAAMRFNVSNEGGIGNVRCLKNCMGTWIVQELRRAWAVRDGSEMAWDEITRRASEAEAFGSFIDPDDPGFFNPANMEAAIKEFCLKTEQSVPSDRGALLRTAYESLALKYRVVNEQISQVCGNETKVVHIVGGGCKNELLNRFTASCLAIPVLAGPEEATAVGNFMVQALGLGVFKSLHEAMPVVKKAFPIKTFLPENPAEWAKQVDRFRKICV